MIPRSHVPSLKDAAKSTEPALEDMFESVDALLGEYAVQCDAAH